MTPGLSGYTFSPTSSNFSSASTSLDFTGTQTIPTTIYVPDDFATIQEAVDVAHDGDTVIVRDGTYAGPGNKDIVMIDKSLLLRSENGPETCIIDCENSGRGFYFATGAADVTLDGFSIINGNRSGYPTWRENSGAGILVYSGSPTIRNCIISGNTAEQHGGGIMNDYGNGLITNCLVTGNTSGSSGGGIRTIHSEPTITDCEISGNNAVAGGGIPLGLTFAGPAGGPLVSNCLITGNTATTSAGGLRLNADVVVTVTDCIFWGNTAPAAPEIFLDDFSTWSPTLDIGYSDVAGGQAAVQLDPNATLIWNPGNINSNPLFASGPLGNHYLSQIAAGEGSDSPCVDTGSVTAISAGLDSLSTRTDGGVDSGTVDMGFHY